MLPLWFSVSDIEQASTADLLMFRSSPCMSVGLKEGGGQEAGGRLARVKSDFFQHMPGFPLHLGWCSAAASGVSRRCFIIASQANGCVTVVLCQHLISRIVERLGVRDRVTRGLKRAENRQKEGRKKAQNFIG